LNIDHPVSPRDTPARYRIEGRRAKSLSSAKAETGVMPGAADRVANN
jgi:hypothetical protein